ncbi:MAG: hypothetical protein ACPG5W_02920 [Flavobacteriales bacterium]
MIRRAALKKMMGFVASASIVKASEFDPLISEERSDYAATCENSIAEYKEPDFYGLKESFPPEVRAGISWIYKVKEENVMNNVFTLHHFENERITIGALILPRSIYRKLALYCYFKKLDSLKPDLTDKQWEAAKRFVEFEQKYYSPKKISTEMLGGALTEFITQWDK